MQQGLHTHFHFTTVALNSAVFNVDSFRGEESLSQLYRFDINLVSEQADIDLNTVLAKAATLTITQQHETRKIHGIISEIELVEERIDGRFNYRAVLVPRLWLLSLTKQNQIFQQKSVPGIIRDLLLESTAECSPHSIHAAIPHDYVAFRLTNGFANKHGDDRCDSEDDNDDDNNSDCDSNQKSHINNPNYNYPLQEYLVQYSETNLNFLSRLMEHEGIFYYFEQHESSERLVITDNNEGCFHHTHQGNHNTKKTDVLPQRKPSGAGAAIHYRGPSRVASSQTVCIKKFSSKHKQLSQQVVLNDYNYRLPHIALEATGTIDKFGLGRLTEYGAHYKTPEEGQHYARLRAEQVYCQQRVYCGEGDHPALATGYHVNLQGHFLQQLNQDYLVCRVSHRGQSAEHDSLNIPNAKRQALHYENTFHCQVSTIPFRPERLTPKPKLYGIMNATIDAVGDGQRAEIDKQGRYKVQLPFDVNGSGQGKASRYIRMATPYGGSNQGMHFPLLKGTEVIWTCIDGDLDRPIIVGSVPNPLNKSVVTGENKTANVIKTPGGIHMEFNDGLPQAEQQSTAHKVRTDCDQPPLTGHLPPNNGHLQGTGNQLTQQQHLSSSCIVSIAEPTPVTEGQDVCFTVTLSEAATTDTTLVFSVSGNGAQSTSDVSTVISAGTSSGTVAVSSMADTDVDNATVTLQLKTVSDPAYTASVAVATATGIVKDSNVGVSTNESCGNKRFKLKVPEWSNDSSSKSSYWRLGNADSTELLESRSDIELGLNSPSDAGVFDYTDGNRTEITDGDREIYVNGKHRMTINSGGLGLYDAEPIYSLWFDELPAGWHKIETGFSSSTSATFGSNESLSFGNTFSGTAGLNTSVSLAGAVSGNLVGSVGFDIGFSVSGSNGYSVSYSTAGSIEKVEKNKTIDAGKSITLTVGGTDTTAKVAYGTAMAAVIGGVGGQFATTMAQAIGAKVQQNEWQPSEAAACQGIGISASALAWVAAMKMGAGIVTGEKVRQKAPSAAKPLIKVTESEILLQCGDASILLKSDGTIDIEAKKVNIDAEKAVDVSGEMYVYDGDLTIQDKDLWVSDGNIVARKGDIDIDAGVLNTSNGNSY